MGRANQPFHLWVRSTAEVIGAGDVGLPCSAPARPSQVLLPPGIPVLSVCGWNVTVLSQCGGRGKREHVT